MRVRTLRKHDNTFGDTFEKPVGKVYEHPDPAQLIRDKIVEDAAKPKAPAKPAATGPKNAKKAGGTRPARAAGAGRRAAARPAAAKPAAETPAPPKPPEPEA